MPRPAAELIDVVPTGSSGSGPSQGDEANLGSRGDDLHPSSHPLCVLHSVFWQKQIRGSCLLEIAH